MEYANLSEVSARRRKAMEDAQAASDAQVNADKVAELKVETDKANKLKAEEDAKVAQDQKYFDVVQKRKDSIAAQKEAVINKPSATTKTTKFDWNQQQPNNVLNGVAMGQAFVKPEYTEMKKGGSVKSKPKVSTASKRGDGCCIKGKTKGRFV
jgi:hypothetical protein